MTDARIPMLAADDAKAAAAAAGIPEMMSDLSVFRVLLRHPTVTGPLAHLLMTLLFEGKLDPRLRELVIMRLGWRTGSVYEWTQHWRASMSIGMSEAEVLGVREWQRYDGYSPADRAVLAATDETLDNGTISPETWAACAAHVGGPEELIELVVAIGNWRMFSSLLRSLDVPLEDGVEAWPPDGRRPSVR